ncbi:hypothetical protein [Sphingomonas sp. Y38-1Y]|uniref:hypothetical protein n=1 Tax=Sphingomonas sp. Y38-1Y TaxID=3078265 RepID=UPI0028EDB6D8|nr:hypothetical protein [Sphingomonas sp. Y38-1Y]
MVALTASQRLKSDPKLLAISIVALAAAAAAAILPTWRIEALVIESGLPALLPAAAPPLGVTARGAIIVLAAAIAAAITWVAAERVLPVRKVVREVARRADRHPDAPVREPVKAMRDLGTPFLEAATPPPERDLPADLETPLASFDPAAIPSEPMTPSAAVRPLFRPEPVAEPEPIVEAKAAETVEDKSVVEHVRIETFEVTPTVRVPSLSLLSSVPERTEPAIAGPETEATIHALLDRLERGVRRRGVSALTERAGAGDLSEALKTLRRFAAAH